MKNLLFKMSIKDSKYSENYTMYKKVNIEM